MDEIKRAQLVKALKLSSGSRTIAAQKLGISVRTVRNWIARFKLNTDYPAIRGKPVKSRQKS